MKKITLTVIAFLLLLILLIASAYLLFFRKVPTPSNDGAFPVLENDIQAQGIQIEEIESPDTRTYILSATLTQPLFTAGNLVKGEFIINGASTRMYFNLGTPENQVLFGRINGTESSWKNEKVSNVSALIGDNRQVRIYVEFPNDLNSFEPNTPAYEFASSQQKNYQILRSIVNNSETAIPQPIEFSINQIGVVE